MNIFGIEIEIMGLVEAAIVIGFAFWVAGYTFTKGKARAEKKN